MKWIWKKLGYHVCEEFTMWEKMQADFEITPTVGGVPMISLQHKVTRFWQERKCLKCGKVYKEYLDRE